MAVAQRFGNKIDTMSIMRIDPTAAYLLTAPSARSAASEIALACARDGERITVSVAKGILGTLGKKPVRREDKSPALPDSKLLEQLLETLESLRHRWHPRLYSVLARQLRDFCRLTGRAAAGKPETKRVKALAVCSRGDATFSCNAK